MLVRLLRLSARMVPNHANFNFVHDVVVIVSFRWVGQQTRFNLSENHTHTEASQISLPFFYTMWRSAGQVHWFIHVWRPPPPRKRFPKPLPFFCPLGFMEPSSFRITWSRELRHSCYGASNGVNPYTLESDGIGANHPAQMARWNLQPPAGQNL